MKDLFIQRNESKKDDNIVLFHILEELKTIKESISSGLSVEETPEMVEIDQKKEESFFYSQEKAVEEVEMPEEPENILEEEPTGYIMIKSPNKPRNRLDYGVKALEEEAIATVTKNKKQIIKQKIIALASKNRITAKQIKEIIVDKYRYCSKATFYRYLTELKKQRRLDTITINEREYVCNVTIESSRNETYGV